MSVTFRLQWCHKSLCLWACLFVCVPFELIDMICAHLAITIGREYKQMHFIEHFRPAVVPFPSFLTTSVDSQEEQSFTPLQSHWDLAPNPILQILRSGKRVVEVLIPIFTVQVRITFFNPLREVSPCRDWTKSRPHLDTSLGVFFIHVPFQ